jgi:hypothetical protein
MSVLSTRRRLLIATIRRHGRAADITRPTDGAVDNFGRPSVVETDVATEWVYPIFSEARDRDSLVLGAGLSFTENPRVLFRYDTAAREGDRLAFDGKSYAIETMIRFDSHYEAETVLLDDGDLNEGR